MARLRFLGPAIVATGAAVAAVGTWYVIHARPVAGDVIDTIAVGSAAEDTSLVIRAEANGGERSFVELRRGGEVVWQAIVPHYIGTHERPAIAWSPGAVTLRVQRSGRAEVFALGMQTSVKLGGFRLAPEHEPNTPPAEGPITLTDHVRSYELVGGAGWHQLVAVDLKTGDALWKVELGAPAVIDGGAGDGVVWVVQRDTGKRAFDALTGKDLGSHNPS